MEDSWHIAPTKATNFSNCKPVRGTAWAHQSRSSWMANNTSQSWAEPALLRVPEVAVAIQPASRRQNLAYTSIPLGENRSIASQVISDWRPNHETFARVAC